MTPIFLGGGGDCFCPVSFEIPGFCESEFENPTRQVNLMWVWLQNWSLKDGVCSTNMEHVEHNTGRLRSWLSFANGWFLASSCSFSGVHTINTTPKLVISEAVYPNFDNMFRQMKSYPRSPLFLKKKNRSSTIVFLTRCRNSTPWISSFRTFVAVPSTNVTPRAASNAKPTTGRVSITSWWFFNQPIWKICSWNWIMNPQIGVNIKNVWKPTPKTILFISKMVP